MRNVARGLAALIALLFLVFGVRYMFAPASALSTLHLEAVDHVGLSTIRAMNGAFFVTIGILLAVHTVIKQNTTPLHVAILFLALSVIGRIIGLVVDGSGGDAIRNVVPVTVILIVSVLSLVLFKRSEV